MTDIEKTLAKFLPSVQFFESNGIQLAYYEVGENKKGKDGVPVVFLHGFPELAFSWRYQLNACKEAGIWAIALEQRGYGKSDAPSSVEAYDLEHLTSDLIGLADHLGFEKAIWCGHDWGAIVAWHMPLVHPDRTKGVIGLNVPFMPRLPIDPIELMRQSMGEQMYIVHFQKPGQADAILNTNVRRAFDFFMRRPSKDVNGVVGLSSQRGESESLFPLVKMIEHYDHNIDDREYFLSKEEFEVFVQTFERTGFTGGINWYRNLTRNWEKTEKLIHRIDGIPCLMITAEKDAVLPPSRAAHMPQLVSELEIAMIKDSGHWTQQEKPQEVNRLILDWVKQHSE